MAASEKNQSMQAQVKWVEGLQFSGVSGSGHQVLLDGEKTAGASPMEMVLIAAASCSSVDVVSILEKARQSITGCECDVKGERADGVPAVFTKIHLHFKVSGTDVAPKHVERAVALSAEKYCSVAKMLEQAVTLTHSFEVIDV